MANLPYVTIYDLCETVVTIVSVEVEGLCLNSC